MKNIIIRFGAPSQLFMDNELNIVGKEDNAFCEKNHFKKKFSSPYYP